MRLLAAYMFAQERADVNYLPRKSTSGEKFPRARQAQCVPMVILHREDAVFADFVEVEEARANAPAGNAANHARL